MSSGAPILTFRTSKREAAATFASASGIGSRPIVQEVGGSGRRPRPSSSRTGTPSRFPARSCSAASKAACAARWPATATRGGSPRRRRADAPAAPPWPPSAAAADSALSPIARDRRRLAAADDPAVLDLDDHVAAGFRNPARESERRAQLQLDRARADHRGHPQTLQNQRRAVEHGEHREPERDRRERPGERGPVRRQSCREEVRVQATSAA